MNKKRSKVVISKKNRRNKQKRKEGGGERLYTFGQADNSVFGSDIGRFVFRGDEAVRRRNVDDSAILVLLHLGQHQPHCVEDCGQIEVDHQIPFVYRELIDRRYMLNACNYKIERLE